jgi:hypothetical protein
MLWIFFEVLLSIFARGGTHFQDSNLRRELLVHEEFLAISKFGRAWS